MAKVTRQKLKPGETFYGGGQGVILRNIMPSHARQADRGQHGDPSVILEARPISAAQAIHELVFEGLMHTPHPDFENEITQKIGEVADESDDVRHLAGGILFWIGRNLDDYNTPEEFTADGQGLIYRYCIKEGIDEAGYEDLVEERWIDSDSD